MTVVIISLAVFIAAALITGVVRKYALHRQLLDIPNARSSHTVPTPRGGGVGIVIAFLIALPAAIFFDLLTVADAVVLALPGALVAGIGFADDHGHIAARWRLLGHFAAAGIGLALLAAVPSVPLTAEITLNGFWLLLPLIVGLVWLLNLYNFMDGIDGIAGVQAVTVCLGLGLLSHWYGNPEDVVLALLLAAASAGFLCWNLPPARIFMGDAGSGFLGIVIGLLWLKIASANPKLFWPGLILMGVFVVDATFTLIVRLRRGERIYEAHRSHAYQHAARRFGSHGKVTTAVAVINLGWLLPVASLTSLGYIPVSLSVTASYAPLMLFAIRLKAGQRGF